MKQVAVIFGGYSPEHSISLESAHAVITHLDRSRYAVLPIGINREGRWFYYAGEAGKIADGTWQGDAQCFPAVLCPDRGQAALYIQKPEGVQRLTADAVFPVLHGRFGEDGTVQGLIALAGLPLVGCGVLASALCMDKDRAHKLVKEAGIAVPRGVCLHSKTEAPQAEKLGREIGYPLFVKPLRAGSSFGIRRVKSETQLTAALQEAFLYDQSVIVEEAIEGFEVGCAIMGRERLTVGEVDEIETHGDLFDFTEKYTLKNSAIHVPARLSAADRERVQHTAKTIYRALDCAGFARVDMFFTPRGRIVFNEVNTIPGFTEHSRFPGMMRAAGLDFGAMLTQLVEEASVQ